MRMGPIILNPLLIYENEVDLKVWVAKKANGTEVHHDGFNQLILWDDKVW